MLPGSFRWQQRRLLNIIKMTLYETKEPNPNISNENIKNDLKVVLRIYKCNYHNNIAFCPKQVGVG
jgi:hypothetical protein